MVVGNALNNLKDKSKDEKKAVASGVAIGVVVILLAAWGFLFFKKLQKGTQLQLGGGAQSEFDFESVKKAQQQLKQEFQYSAEELRTIRDSAVSGQIGTDVQTGEGSGDEPFDAPQDSF